jgi:hypothetical protein
MQCIKCIVAIDNSLCYSAYLEIYLGIVMIILIAFILGYITGAILAYLWLRCFF